MAEKGDLTKQESKAPEQQQNIERSIRPAVDIFEDKMGITLQADMPGVSKERLNVRVDHDTLSIEGDATITMPGGMEPLHADIRATHYQRSFTLSRELDTGKIDASLKDGVLTVRIPKLEELQPRKIEIRSG